MEKKDTTNVFQIGQPVCLSVLSGLPLMKLAQEENTMTFNNKMYIVGRILKESIRDDISNSKYEENIFVITPMGFIIGCNKRYIHTFPLAKMEKFLKHEENMLLKKSLLPYTGRLIKSSTNEWFIPETN